MGGWLLPYKQVGRGKSVSLFFIPIVQYGEKSALPAETLCPSALLYEFLNAPSLSQQGV